MSREIDAQVAEKVMGWKVIDDGEDRDDYPIVTWHEGSEYQPDRYLFWAGEDVDGVEWSPSTDIAAAWEVAEKLTAKLRYKIAIETYEGEVYTIKPCGVSAITAPMAICLAALKAMEVSDVSKHTS